jgi:hypothetical protein
MKRKNHNMTHIGNDDLEGLTEQISEGLEVSDEILISEILILAILCEVFFEVDFDDDLEDRLLNDEMIYSLV